MKLLPCAFTVALAIPANTIATKTIILNNTVVFIIVYFLFVQHSVFILLFIRRIKRLKRLQPSEVFFIFLRCPLATIEMQRACQNDN